MNIIPKKIDKIWQGLIMSVGVGAVLLLVLSLFGFLLFFFINSTGRFVGQVIVLMWVIILIWIDPILKLLKQTSIWTIDTSWKRLVYLIGMIILLSLCIWIIYLCLS